MYAKKESLPRVPESNSLNTVANIPTMNANKDCSPGFDLYECTLISLGKQNTVSELPIVHISDDILI